MTAYYNDNDPNAGAWLRELIKVGVIAPGEVDVRDVRDVQPSDLSGFVQCHFFAGIGAWSYALRLANWSDDTPVWTGSCPCQPFSAAGKGAGFADERHVWPAWYHLVSECRPRVLFGEQVASQDGLSWLDLVLSDLEGAGYAAGAIDLCAAGVGAPHIRQRLYFVADAAGSGWLARGRASGSSDGRDPARVEPGRFCDARELADPHGWERDRLASRQGRRTHRSAPGWQQGHGQLEFGSEICGVAESGRERLQELGLHLQPGQARFPFAEVGGCGETGELGDAGRTRSGRHSGAVPRPQGAGEGERLDAWDLPHESESPGAVGELGDAERTRLEGYGGHGDRTDGWAQSSRSAPAAGDARALADDAHERWGESGQNFGGLAPGDLPEGLPTGSVSGSGVIGMADADGGEPWDRDVQPGREYGQQPQDASPRDGVELPGPTNGFWRSADWLSCRDGKFRPVEPGTFPLAHGAAARVGRLRGYGNALVVQQAAAFIQAYTDELI